MLPTQIRTTIRAALGAEATWRLAIFYSRGTYSITTPSGRAIEGPPSGSYWRISEEELKRLDGDGRIFWGAGGDSRPYLKRYLSEVRESRVPSSVWHPEEVGFVRNGKEEVRAVIGDVFATPKPEKLIERILRIGSCEGDIVLDCFLGSGTTAVVAHKMRRKWIGIEWSKDTVAKFALPRLEKVVSGEDLGGISQAVEWSGGGGFRILNVGASMFDSDEGAVVLAEWATNGNLAKVTAAQLHFSVDDDPPFCGRKGKHRLAVVDGLISADVVDLLVARLDEGEELTLCGTSVDPDAESRLKELRSGSRIKKIPASLLADYQQSTRWKAPRRREPAEPPTSDQQNSVTIESLP